MITVRIENIEQIKLAFELSPVNMTKELDKAIKLSMLNVQSETLLNLSGTRGINKITGGLYKSVARGVTFETLKATLYPNINYAGYVHEGTYKMRARPFIKDAFRTQDKQIQQYFVNAVDNVLRGIGSLA